MVFRRQSRYQGTEDNEGSKLPRGRLGKKTGPPEVGSGPTPMMPLESVERLKDKSKTFGIKRSTDLTATWKTQGTPEPKKEPAPKIDPSLRSKDGGWLGGSSPKPDVEKRRKEVSTFFPKDMIKKLDELGEKVDVKKGPINKAASSGDDASTTGGKKQQKALTGQKVEDVDFAEEFEDTDLLEVEDTLDDPYKDVSGTDLFDMM